MNTNRILKLITVRLIGAQALANTGAYAEGIDTRIGALSFTHDFANGVGTSPFITETSQGGLEAQHACLSCL
jgi:hypothetical protein